MTVRCRRCKTKVKVKVKAKGPLPLYCSQRCRQTVYEQRKYSGPMVMLAQDLATAKVRDAIRAEVLSVLTRAGFDIPPPPTRPRPKKTRATHLRVIDSNT
jgi:hypothetical protein